MFVFNLKLNKVFKIFFVCVAIIMIIFFIIGAYKIFSGAYGYFNVSDNVKNDNIVNLNTGNYTNVLKAVHENIDSYVGITINLTGYVYRVVDLQESQFILARDMVVSSDYQAVVVGFLCNYEKATDFSDNTWINITGTITKGNYHGDMPVIEIKEINQVDKPNDEYVYPPDDNYVPTSGVI